MSAVELELRWCLEARRCTESDRMCIWEVPDSCDGSLPRADWQLHRPMEEWQDDRVKDSGEIAGEVRVNPDRDRDAAESADRRGLQIPDLGGGDLFEAFALFFAAYLQAVRWWIQSEIREDQRSSDPKFQEILVGWFDPIPRWPYWHESDPDPWNVLETRNHRAAAFGFIRIDQHKHSQAWRIAPRVTEGRLRRLFNCPRQPPLTKLKTPLKNNNQNSAKRSSPRNLSFTRIPGQILHPSKKAHLACFHNLAQSADHRGPDRPGLPSEKDDPPNRRTRQAKIQARPLRKRTTKISNPSKRQKDQRLIVNRGTTITRDFQTHDHSHLAYFRTT